MNSLNYYKFTLKCSVAVNFILLLLILFFAITLECSEKTSNVTFEQAEPVKKKLMPPLFDLGDVVKQPDSNQLGIVISIVLQDDQVTWRYTIQFRETTMYSNEEELRLYKRAEWHAKTDPEVDHKSFTENEQILP